MHGAGEVCKSPDRSLVNSEARTQSNTPALITKCHFSRACFISYINYHGSLHFCASRSESEPFFIRFLIRSQLIQCNCRTAGGIWTAHLCRSPVCVSLKSGAVIICRCSSWQEREGIGGRGARVWLHATASNIP